MIKVLWVVSSEKVQVERYNNSSNHTHSLLEVDRMKRLKVIIDLVEIEAAKIIRPQQSHLPSRNTQRWS